jgi:enoyl-CoA hydratase
MFSGRHITAAEAQQVGIINRVVPKEQLDAEVDSLARTIASKSALALKFLKRTIRQADEMHLSAGLAYERSMISLLFESADAHEGCSAFLEKRKPKFTGQ